MLSVSGLSKSYGTVRGLCDVSLPSGRGQIVGLLGPNGAGKTTTMRIVTGYLEPDAGEVCVVRHLIGYLPEHTPLYDDMEVASSLAYVGGLRGMRGERLSSRMRSVIAECGLGEAVGRVIGHLSKGYRQRV